MEKTAKETHLLKIGDAIVFGKSGVDYTLEPGTVYVPKVDYMSEEIQLNFGNSLTMPEKMYIPESDKKFVNKVLDSYALSTRTMGVLLAGLKGTGKTVMAKHIAKQSNLPILTVDNSLHPNFLKTLFTKLENTPMCIIFDEFDKLGERYDSDQILRVLDGISSSGKHLVLFTCNETENVNAYMLDRCGRIRYYREFDEMNPSMITEILTDRLVDKSEAKVLTDFIVKNFSIVSFDNITAFVDEVNNYPNDTYEELFRDMNISPKD